MNQWSIYKLRDFRRDPTRTARLSHLIRPLPWRHMTFLGCFGPVSSSFSCINGPKLPLKKQNIIDHVLQGSTRIPRVTMATRLTLPKTRNVAAPKSLLQEVFRQIASLKIPTRFSGRKRQSLQGLGIFLQKMDFQRKSASPFLQKSAWIFLSETEPS